MNYSITILKLLYQNKNRLDRVEYDVNIVKNIYNMINI